MKSKFPYYHGTQCKALASVLKQGLVVPERGGVHLESVQDKERDPDMTEDRAFDRGIYLTETIEGALTYAFDASKDVPPEYLEMDDFDVDFDNVCILEVVCLGKGAKVGPDGYGDLMTNKDIPASCLKPLKRTDIERKIGMDLEEYYYET